MTIFSKLGPKCVQYVDQVVPRFLTVIRDCRKEGDLKQVLCSSEIPLALLFFPLSPYIILFIHLKPTA
jgi:hypothetical protein